MNNTIKYKNYIGSIEFSEEDNIFYGKVLGIKALISYEGATAQELKDDFHNAVDDYLTLCTQQNIEPERAYKGVFNVRISPALHKAAAVYAIANSTTLNSVVENALRQALKV